MAYLAIKDIFSTTETRESKTKTVLLAVGLCSMLFSLFFTWNPLIFGYPDGVDQFGFIGAIIFLSIITYMVVKFKMFGMKLLATQALVWGIAILTGSQLFFIKIPINFILTSITFVGVVISGGFLIKAVKKEDTLNEQLKMANAGQTNLIHIMNHQIKGYLGVCKNIFAELQTDDYGKIPEEAKEIVGKGFESSDKGQKYVTDILKGASAINGTLPFDMQKIDFKEIVSKVIENQKEKIEKKNLKLGVSISEGDYTMIGDSTQLGEMIRNLIENSVYYTPSGEIFIHLKHKKDKIIFSIKDTGVGIKEEDQPKIFKAGGVSTESIKINVNSSGYGLAFVRGVVEKHKGKVWFESAGYNMGTKFVIELPVK